MLQCLRRFSAVHSRIRKFPYGILRTGKEECHTPGDSRMDSCIYSLFGREFAAGLLKADTSDGGVTVEGYVSKPVSARGNRSYQFFFVNGRYVKSKTLQAALEQAFKNTMFTGRFPACVLYITLNPCDVDVNVHPTKTEVKFVKERQVFDGVYYGVLSALENDVESPEINLTDGTKKLFVESVRADNSERATHDGRKSVHFGFRDSQTDKISRTEFAGRFISRAPSMPEKSLYAAVHNDTIIPYKSETDDIEAAIECDDQTSMEISDMPKKKTYRIVGEALSTYIMAEQGDSLWLIDKHAAP